MFSRPLTRDYWDTVIIESASAKREILWRAHLKKIYKELFTRWNDKTICGLMLKTDLYDEAITRYDLLSLLCRKEVHIIGCDISQEVAKTARHKMNHVWVGWNNAVCSDITQLAFKSRSFDQILSNSTLDHFPHSKGITTGLKELLRIMKPGGTLIITLDNPHNPIIFLRKILPYRFLRWLGLVPYYMGKTVSKSKLVHTLRSIGFSVCESTYIVHSPRIVAIWTGYIIDRIGIETFKHFFHGLLGMFEHLERLPLKTITGHFIAVKAVKKT